MPLKYEVLIHVFDIDEVDYATYIKLSQKTGRRFIKRFVKKNMTAKNINNFLVNKSTYINYTHIFKEKLELLGLKPIDGMSIYNIHNEQQIKSLRDEYLQFDRMLKLKVLETWH